MRNILAIARNSLSVFFADRENLVGLLVMPLVFTIVLGVALGQGGGPSQIRIDVVDLDDTESSRQLMADLRAANETLYLCPADNDAGDRCRLGEQTTLGLEEALERVRGNTTNALIVIPPGFGQHMAAFTPVTIQYYSTEDITSPGVVYPTVQAVVQRLNGAIVAARVGGSIGARLRLPGGGPALADSAAQEAFSRAIYERANTMLAQPGVSVEYQLSESSGQAATSGAGIGFGQSVPGMGSMFVMFTVLGGLALLLRERARWTLQRLAAMPIRRAEILGGFILAYFTLGMIQYFVVFAVGVIAGLNFGSNLIGILLVMAAFVLCVTALTFALATRIRSEGQAATLSTLVVLTLAPLGGAWWPLEIVPEVMRAVGRVSPVAWAMDGFNTLIFYGGGLVDVLPGVGVLLLMTAGLFAIGILGFKYE